MDDTGNTTFGGGRSVFLSAVRSFAFQAFKTDREGQFDAGLVDHASVPIFQAACSPAWYADLAQFGSTLGRSALTLDYLFKDGSIGFFGTEASRIPPW